MTYATRTVIESRPHCRIASRQLNLTHRSAGTQIAGAGTIQVGEAWGVTWEMEGARHGQWFKTESEARAYFDKWSAQPEQAATPAPESLFIVTGRSVDGCEYFTPFGWQGCRQSAFVMSLEDATRIAEAEEKKQAATRNPDHGIYAIAATLWRGPSLYTFADYQRDCAEAEEFDWLYLESE